VRRFDWKLFLGLILVVLSALVYLLHYFIFRDSHHIFIYLIGDVAFVFIEVLMVTLIIHRLLSQRERRSRLEKLNMVIGTFFSEVGTELLIYLSDCDPNLEDIRKNLIIDTDWTAADFLAVSKKLRRYKYGIKIDRVDLQRLHNYLRDKRSFLVRLLENPVLLEHESFTNLLRAVFHLAEELTSRGTLVDLPETDLQHLNGDIKRAYIQLVREWLDYMKYLKNNYPYLFSLAMRTNPFDQTASPVVK
jgi:hypothetical protein